MAEQTNYIDIDCFKHSWSVKKNSLTRDLVQNVSESNCVKNVHDILKITTADSL